jgi:DNA-directed RNA polymerase specialized sigma subunit
MSRRPIDDHQHFRVFAQNLEKAIAAYGDIPQDQLLVRQRQQVENLVALEKEFRRTLIRHPWGPSVYRDFIKMICDGKKNILSARPYFRERQSVFTSKISRVLKRRAEKGLFRFHFNFNFIRFVLGARNWTGNRIGSRIVFLAKQIHQARTELVEMNLPLAISRARIFWSRTPKAQLSYMDLVQITAEGLMSGVDKFVLPYTPAFRAVLIGRMLGNLIESYSDTLVHFFPGDKRKIYRANKAVARYGGDYERIAFAVNRDAEAAHRTTPTEIASLLAAASTVSADVPLGTEEERQEVTVLDSFQAREDSQPDVQFEHREAMDSLASAVVQLPLVDRKLLRLKGVAL